MSSFKLPADDVEEIPEEDEEQGKGDIGMNFMSSSSFIQTFGSTCSGIDAFSDDMSDEATKRTYGKKKTDMGESLF